MAPRAGAKPPTLDDEIADAEVVDEYEHDQAMQNLPAVLAHEAVMAKGELTVDEVVAQRDKIVQVMERVMREDKNDGRGGHYGVIPGTNKPSLLKPGAEAICVALRLAPFYESDKHFDGDHLTASVVCTLKHVPTGLAVSQGEGLCSSKESKYAWRRAQRTCPECGEPQIRRSKFPPKEGDSIYMEGGPNEPGWYCWKKEGGCGFQFPADDSRITSQSEGRATNPDLPDTWNTVLKMADKRALIAAVLNGTAASDVFTQDVEDQQAARQNEEREPRRQSGPPPTTVPKSYPEMRERLTQAYDPVTAVAFSIFAGEYAFKVYDGANIGDLFGKLDPASLTTGQWGELGQKAAGAVVRLLEDVPPGGAIPPSREQMAAAWAKVTGGTVLDGPAWRMGPDETDRPVYEGGS